MQLVYHWPDNFQFSHQRASTSEFVSIIQPLIQRHLLLSPLLSFLHLRLQRFLFLQHSAIFFRRRYPAAGLSKSQERVRTMDYDAPNQPSSLLMFTNDSDYISPHFSFPTTDLFFSPSTLVVQDENNSTHLDDLRRSRHSSLALNYPSPAIPSSPQPTFDPSPRLSLNFGNTTVHTPNAPLPQISTPKVHCLSIKLDPFLDSLCQMTSSNRILVFPLSTLPMVMMI